MINLNVKYTQFHISGTFLLFSNPNFVVISHTWIKSPKPLNHKRKTQAKLQWRFSSRSAAAMQQSLRGSASWQIYCLRHAIGRQRDTSDLMLATYWLSSDREIYWPPVICCWASLRWIMSFALIGHRSCVRLQP